jgi:hypothetical protein
LEVIVATVAVNVALLCPAPTLTVAGTVTFPLPLVTPTVAPDPAAAAVSVMVHVALPGAFTVPGAQLNELGCAGPVGAVRLVLAVWLTPFNVAVTATVVALAMVPAVAVNVALLCPNATLTVAGTLNSAGLALDNTTVSAAGAAVFNVTVQVLVALAVSVEGAHVRLVIRGGVAVSVKIWLAPFRLAVSNAVCVLIIDPTAAVNVAAPCPASTLTVAGTVTLGLLLVRATATPFAPAGAARVMVQFVEPGVTTVVGEQVNPLNGDEALNAMLAVWLTPFSVAVTTTVVALAMVPAVAVNVALL